MRYVLLIHSNRESWAALSADGPFVESKEHLAGFYVVECDGEDDAVALATRLPDARIDAVEVRPVADA